MYIYIYTHTHTHRYIHTSIHTDIHAYINTYMVDTAREVHVGQFQGPRQLWDSPCRLWVSLLAACSEQTDKEGRLCLGSKNAIFIEMSL